MARKIGKEREIESKTERDRETEILSSVLHMGCWEERRSKEAFKTFAGGKHCTNTHTLYCKETKIKINIF